MLPLLLPLLPLPLLGPAPVASDWKDDPVWYDGRAEVCVYEATRSIYGLERRFLATAYTNKQQMDPDSTVKGSGVEVFKHHWSERVPTENYDYDFSTAAFLRTADLTPFKLTASTQDDCGSSFKQLRVDGDDLAWNEFVYFPGGGPREGRFQARGVSLQDGFTLSLRTLAAAEEGTRQWLTSVPRQKVTRRVPFTPRPLVAVVRGTAELELPVGKIRARRIDVEEGGRRLESYWFDVRGGAPWLHALVRYEGPGGVTYRLKSQRRWAYWERG